MTDHESLITAAKQSRENAHAPYSNFRVGAALRASSGRIFGGCNVENATYGLTVCAERIALFKALSEGERNFDAIAVVTDVDRLTPPCGACRQLLWEFCGDLPVTLANLQRSKIPPPSLSPAGARLRARTRDPCYAQRTQSPRKPHPSPRGRGSGRPGSPHPRATRRHRKR